jgi:hypothetical protein
VGWCRGSRSARAAPGASADTACVLHVPADRAARFCQYRSSSRGKWTASQAGPR